MKVRLEIIALENNGESVTVKAQGKGNEAEWRPMQVWTMRVPEYVGRRYRIGQIVKVTLKS